MIFGSLRWLERLCKVRYAGLIIALKGNNRLNIVMYGLLSLLVYSGRPPLSGLKSLSLNIEDVICHTLYVSSTSPLSRGSAHANAPWMALLFPAHFLLSFLFPPQLFEVDALGQGRSLVMEITTDVIVQSVGTILTFQF